MPESTNPMPFGCCNMDNRTIDGVRRQYYCAKLSGRHMCTDWLELDAALKYKDPYLLNGFQQYNNSKCYNTFLASDFGKGAAVSTDDSMQLRVSQHAKMQLGTTFHFEPGSNCTWLVSGDNQYGAYKDLTMTVDLKATAVNAESTSVYRMYSGDSFKDIVAGRGSLTNLTNGTSITLEQNKFYLILAVCKDKNDYFHATFAYSEKLPLIVIFGISMGSLCCFISIIAGIIMCALQCMAGPMANSMRRRVMGTANDVLYMMKEADQKHEDELVKRFTA